MGALTESEGFFSDSRGDAVQPGGIFGAVEVFIPAGDKADHAAAGLHMGAKALGIAHYNIGAIDGGGGVDAQRDGVHAHDADSSGLPGGGADLPALRLYHAQEVGIFQVDTGRIRSQQLLQGRHIHGSRLP